VTHFLSAKQEWAGSLGQAKAAVRRGATLTLSSQGPRVSFFQNTLKFEAVSFPVPLSCTQNLRLAWSRPTNAPSLGELGGGSAAGRAIRAGDFGSPGSPCFIAGWGVLGCTAGSQGHSAMPISSHPCWLAPSSSWRCRLPCSPSSSRARQPSRQQGLTRSSCD